MNAGFSRYRPGRNHAVFSAFNPRRRYRSRQKRLVDENADFSRRVGNHKAAAKVYFAGAG
jgi:hypothetical protein